MRSLKPNCITCDHTFKSVCDISYARSEDGKLINQYNSAFCVLNEKGKVINWQFTASEGFEEVKELFVELKTGLTTRWVNVISIICHRCIFKKIWLGDHVLYINNT